MTNVIDSFSYDIAKAATVQQAKDKAKEEGFKSFSRYLLKLLEEDIKQKKAEASGERLPILNGSVSRQTTISEYDIKLFQPSELRARNLAVLTREQQTKLAIDVVQLQRQLHAVRKK